MKKTVALSVAFFIGITICLAQRSVPLVNMDQQPLILVDSKETDLNHLLLEPDRISSIDVLKDSSATNQYGEKAKNGVIIIRPKKNTEMLSFDELLDSFNVPVADRKLIVCIDNVLIHDGSLLLADKADIIKVEIINDLYWITPVEPGHEAKYINIITRKGRKLTT